ncbi:hypothetical protein D3C71_813820 [compost metagenome]
MLDPAQGECVVLMAERGQVIALGTHLFQFDKQLRGRQRNGAKTVFTQQPQTRGGVLPPVFLQNPQRVVQPGQHLDAV